MSYRCLPRAAGNETRAGMSTSTPSHRSRKKRVTIAAPLERTPTTADIVTVDTKSNAIKPEFPLVAFLWPARGTTSQWILIPLILIAVGLFRWSVGFWGYSGMLNESSLNALAYGPQASRNCLCTETLRLNDTGWRSPSTFPFHLGIFSIYHTGV